MFKTDKGTKGQFAQFAVHVNLNLPLVLKVRIANKLHRVEYESLPQICFDYGKFGYLMDVCPETLNGATNGVDNNNEKGLIQVPEEQKVQLKVEKENYGD